MKPFIPSRVAEVIFALVIAAFGINQIMYASDMAGRIPDYMPGDAKVWVYLTSAVMLLAAIAIIIKKFKTVACYILAAMMIVFVIAVHLKPAMDGDMTGLLNDTAIAMAAILIGNRK